MGKQQLPALEIEILSSNAVRRPNKAEHLRHEGYRPGRGTAALAIAALVAGGAIWQYGPGGAQPASEQSQAATLSTRPPEKTPAEQLNEQLEAEITHATNNIALRTNQEGFFVTAAGQVGVRATKYQVEVSLSDTYKSPTTLRAGAVQQISVTRYEDDATSTHERVTMQRMPHGGWSGTHYTTNTWVGFNTTPQMDALSTYNSQQAAEAMHWQLLALFPNTPR
jgi:hypothetical protein